MYGDLINKCGCLGGKLIGAGGGGFSLNGCQKQEKTLKLLKKKVICV